MDTSQGSSITTATAPSDSTTAPSSAVTATSVDLATIATGEIVGFGLSEADLGDEHFVLAVADTSSLRARGLMGVSDFGDVDGMIFTWAGELVTSAFTMRDTLVPLTIVFFDPEGSMVGSFDMIPCTADPCPSYQAQAPYAFAIEFPQGQVIPIDATLQLHDE